jgi:glutamate-5-semialdehyde dehydrogenase
MIEIGQYTQEICVRAKKASREIKSLNTIRKNSFLKALAKNLLSAEAEICKENEKDLQEAKVKNLSSALTDRLLLNKKRIEGLANSVLEISNLPDPIGEVIRGTTLPNGLDLVTKRVPLGVILVIYESRPNVTIDVGALSFKSGNACILRGGSEAIHTNIYLAELFRKTLKENSIHPDSLVLVEKTDRSILIPLLKKHASIDLVVPRGGEGLINFVTENSSIPVVKHDKGVCNMFIDQSADLQIAINVVLNSKVQRPGVCNALENLVIHKNFEGTEKLLQALMDASVELYLDEPWLSKFPNAKTATEESYSTEFLDLRLSVKTVSSIDEAISFIEKYSSGHTEAILSESVTAIDKFKNSLDSAAIFVNCSTRFHDGGEFGLGSEVGISTGKLHVRGPMGLVHLTTTTTYLHGSGQVRA